MKGSKTVAKATSKGQTVLMSGLSKNKVYDLYVRTGTINPDTYAVTYGNWSHVKKFCTVRCPIGKIGTSGFWLKTPKIKGVKKYKIYIGYNSKYQWKKNQKFKHYFTLKPGKKKKLKKLGGKSFKSKLGIYYVRVVPQNKKGKIPGYSTIKKAYDFYYATGIRY